MIGGGVRVLAAAAAAGMLAGGLVACGSGGSSTTRVSTSTATATATVTTSGPGTGASTGARAPRARAGAPACAATGVTLGHGSAGLGHFGQVLLFRNTGPQTCHLTGYPGLALAPAASGGRELQVARTPNGYLGGLSTTAKSNPVVVLRPGQQASALLEGLDASQPSGGPCPRYAAVLVTPPNQTTTVRLARRLAICNPEVHPVVPGTSGRQS